jgi:hypothetical protein
MQIIKPILLQPIDQELVVLEAILDKMRTKHSLEIKHNDS